MNNGFGWIERALNIIDKYRIKTIFKGVFLVVTIMFTVKFVENPTYIFEKYKEWETRQHTIALEKRMKNNAQIQTLCEKLLYKLNAKRVVVLELHNGLTSNGNLPFAKCSATYEALNDGVAPVSQQYQNTNLTLMPFAFELFKTNYFCGDSKQLLDIDKGLYYKLMSNGTEHFACSVVNGVDKPLAIIMVSFEEVVDEVHNCEEVHNAIHQFALELALLMEIKALN